MTRIKILAASGVFALLFAAGAGAQSAKPALYTAEQAQAGAAIYAQACGGCHGGALEGGGAPELKGAAFNARAVAQGMTPQSLHEVVANTMPQTDPGGLKPEDYNAVVAYLLQQNGFPAGTTALAPNAPGMKETRVTP
jgi:mono/diheme cytochrome c family protein